MSRGWPRRPSCPGLGLTGEDSSLSCPRIPGLQGGSQGTGLLSWGSWQAVRRHSVRPAPPGPWGALWVGEGTYRRLPHADPRLRHRFGRFCLNHRSCRGPHGPGLLGLEGQLIGYLKCLPQGQDDLIGEVLGRSRVCPLSSSADSCRPHTPHREWETFSFRKQKFKPGSGDTPL